MRHFLWIVLAALVLVMPAAAQVFVPQGFFNNEASSPPPPFSNVYSLLNDGNPGVDGNQKALTRGANPPSTNHDKATISFWFKVADRDFADVPTLAAGVYISGTPELYFQSFGVALASGGIVSVTIAENPTGQQDVVFTQSEVYANDIWYNCVIQIDTTEAIDADRVKIFVNGSDVTDPGASTYPPQNTAFYGSSGLSAILDFMAVFLEGSPDQNVNLNQLAFFGGQIYSYSDVNTGGVPKDLSGLTFGPGSFWLQLSSGTVTTIGIDQSGQGTTFSNGGTVGGSPADPFVDGDFVMDVP